MEISARPTRPHWRYLSIAAVSAAVLISGCTTLSPGARATHAERYLTDIRIQSAQTLPENHELDLDQCIEIALANNLDIRIADLNTTLAGLEQDIAFANFLPRVQASAGLTSWDQQPSSVLAGLLVAPIQDETIRDYAVDVQLPIFLPATWFLYSVRGHGAAAAALAADYSRQGIALQVTAKYYECLAVEATRAAVASQLVTTQAMERELAAMHGEGLIVNSALKGAQTAVRASQVSLGELDRSTRRAKAELLALMGLYPLEDIALKAIAPFAPATDPAEDLIAVTLMTHPELHIADRQVAVSEDAVRLAVAEFLPKLMGFASFFGNTNSLSLPASNVLGGLSGVLTVFDGFADVSEYRAARERRTKAFAEREARCLALMTQVVVARLNERSAFDHLDAATLDVAAAQARLEEAEAQWEEGLLLPSERLEAVARAEASRMRQTNRQYQHQLSAAVLRHATGAAYTGR